MATKVKKIKRKTHSGASKRLKRTGTGKLRAKGRAYTSHLATHKTQKQKRQLRGKLVLFKGDQKRVNDMVD